jgi:O-antigen ligase
VFEAITSSTWNDFVVNTVKYPRYDFNVLHSFPPNATDIRVYGVIGGHRFVRVGSVFLDSLACGWYLILPFAIGIERMVRRAATPLVVASTVLVAAALVLTQTRSAVLGALVVAALAVVPAAGRQRNWRTQATILLAALAVFGIPSAFASGLSRRVAQGPNPTDQSTAGHLAGFSKGLSTIGKHPLGQGLGTGAGTGQRLGVANYTVAENSYLNVGDELGLVGLILFVGTVIALIVDLRYAARGSPDVLVTAAWAGGLGLVLAAWFLQTWSNFPVSWTFWAVAGAALGAAREHATATAKAEQPATGTYTPSLAPALSSTSR